MNRDSAPYLANESSLLDQLIDLLRRVLTPAWGPRLVPVPVPVRDPIIRRRG